MYQERVSPRNFSFVRLIFIQNIIEEECHNGSQDEGQGLVGDFNKTFGYHIPDQGDW